MKKGKKIFLIISVFLIFNFISASFEIGDLSYSIEKQYPPNDPIKGWINISLNNEPGDSLFVDSFDNKISLTELLNLNSDSDYTCFPNDCQNDYSENNAETTKTFNLNPAEVKIIGLKLTGENFERILTTLSMNVSSTIGESNFPQFYIDILNDGIGKDDKIEWLPYTPSNNFYNEKNGCYKTPDETIWIKDQRFCEKINVSIAPNVEIGAYVIEDTGGNVDFNLNICDLNNNCGFCVATASNTGRISCIADYQINEKQDFFVCIKTKNFQDNTKYSINSETNEPCGYAGNKVNKRDFEIFAKPGKYSAPGEFTLNNNEIQASGKNFNLKSGIEEYIRSRYNNDCSNTCIVPIKFISERSQAITVSNINMDYDVSGVTRRVTEVYDLTEITPKINSGFQKLNLDHANLFVSGNFGESITYSLKFNNEQIFSQDILIKRIPKIVSLNNREIIAAYPAEFVVKIETFDSFEKITEYKWEFGDGTISITSENKTTHIYNSTGSFELKVSITDSGNLTSSKIFNITVSTPKNSVEVVLKDKLDNLNKINSQIENFPAFHKNSLNSVLNLEEIEEEISSLQQKNLIASSDEDYVAIMSDLIKLNIPESVFVTKSISSVGFYPEKNKINLQFLEDISRPISEDKKSDYIDSIILWNLENINVEINSKEFSTIYEDSIEFVLNVFEINVKENKANENALLIIPKFDGIVFKENYLEKEKSEYFYIELTGEDNEKIEFSITEDIEFSVLPVFISPRIEELVIISGKISENEKKLSDQTLAILVILLITFIGVIAYIIVQEWYKRKYKDYLFKNKNSLYNLISYIENAKTKHVKAKEISSKLRDAGWKPEQVRYVMRKYVGKRTGMFEIPIEKILKFFGKKEKPSISKRNFPPRRNQFMKYL